MLALAYAAYLRPRCPDCFGLDIESCALRGLPDRTPQKKAAKCGLFLWCPDN